MHTSLYNSNKRYKTALLYRAKETTNDKIQPQGWYKGSRQWYCTMACHLLQNYSLQWVIAILKTNSGFFAQSSRFFTKLTRFLALQSWLDSFNQTDLSFFPEHQFNYFKEPTQKFFTELSRFFFLFCIIKQGACPQLAMLSCKRTRGFTHLRLPRVNHQFEFNFFKKMCGVSLGTRNHSMLVFKCVIDV